MEIILEGGWNSCFDVDVLIITLIKVIMQGKLFQRCTNLLNSSVVFLGGNINTRRLSQPDIGSLFFIKNQWNILVIGNYCVNYQNYENLMLLTSSDAKRTLMHLFLFTNSAQRELASICTQSIYATAINFPCIITLRWLVLNIWWFWWLKYECISQNATLHLSDRDL